MWVILLYFVDRKAAIQYNILYIKLVEYIDLFKRKVCINPAAKTK